MQNNLCDIFNNISNFNIPQELSTEENELMLPLKDNKELISNILIVLISGIMKVLKNK